MTYNKTILYFVQITLKWPCYFKLYLMMYFQTRWKEEKSIIFLSCLSYESKNMTVRLCCNVQTVPFLLAVCNNFYLLTSTPPNFRSTLSRTILNSFIKKNFHLLFIVALIYNNAVAFFFLYMTIFFALLLFLIFLTFNRH